MNKLNIEYYVFIIAYYLSVRFYLYEKSINY